MTTNMVFSASSEVFSNAACVVSLVSRLIYHFKVISIERESYRLKKQRIIPSNTDANSERESRDAMALAVRVAARHSLCHL